MYNNSFHISDFNFKQPTASTVTLLYGINT